MKKAQICLIAPGHVSSTPRLVKEAAALQSAGYGVHVVAGRYYRPVEAADNTVFKTATWPRTVVNYGKGPRAIWAKLRRRLARWRLGQSANPGLITAARAHYAPTLWLAAAAARIPADLYIGHGVAGLAAAALAARRRGARYGFDAEDFHSGETEAAVSDPILAAAIRLLESALLPGCAYITAASPLIAQAYVTAYKLSRPPAVVLNVFPKSEAPGSPWEPPAADGRPARLYWFSQTVAEGRGLEPLIDVLGRMNHPTSLHLRGMVAPSYAEGLRQRAARAGFKGEIEFLPFAAPAEMSRLASVYDLGFSIEPRTPLNRELCLANKIFVYLLAGLPAVLTPTRAQSRLAVDLGEAALVVDLEKPEQAAANLDALLQGPVRLAAARSASWRLGQDRYNWDYEQHRFLAAIDACFHS